MNKEELLDELYNHILNGNKLPVIDLTNKGLDLGLTPSELLWDSMIPGLEEVGRLFETGEYFVPEMLVSARSMQGAMDILTPLMAKEGTKKLGKFLWNGIGWKVSIIDLTLHLRLYILPMGALGLKTGRM